MEVRYEPGAALAAVAGDGAVLLDASVDGQVAESVLAALRSCADVAGLLEALGAGAGADLRALPGFAVVVREGERLRVVVRGGATVRALTPDGVRTVDAAGVTTWTEVALPPATSVEVTASSTGAVPAGDASGAGLPVADGIVRAGSLTVPPPDAGGGPPPTERPASVPSVPHADDDWGSTVLAPRADRAAPTAELPAADAESATDAEPPAVPEAPTVAPPAEPEPATVTPPAGTAPTDDADEMWADTVLSAPTPAAPGLGLAVGHRVVPATAPPPSVDPDATLVLGRSCPDGHPNRPERERCAVCDEPLAGPARSVARPTLGSVRLSTGETVPLDRPLVVGRRPQATRVGHGRMPRLVAVPDDRQDISRSHVEIRLEEWHVLVVDLGTTNGTTLVRRGQPVARLHPREPVLVVGGDVVDLGEGVTLTFEDLP